MGVQTGAGLLNYCVLCLPEAFDFSLFIDRDRTPLSPLFYQYPSGFLYEESIDSKVQSSVVDRVKQSTFPESN